MTCMLSARLRSFALPSVVGLEGGRDEMLEVEVLGVPAAFAGVPSLERIERLCALAASSAGVQDAHMAIEFIDAEAITRLNAKHRGKPEPTDVLSFPVDGMGMGAATQQHIQATMPGGGDVPCELGDVLICPEHTTDVGEAIVHGVLHLVGMDHETDDGEMLALQAELLSWDA
jgi:probable rRNA maturation factor